MGYAHTYIVIKSNCRMHDQVLSLPAVCTQVASQHVPKGACDYVTIAYVPLKGEQ